MFTAPLVGLRNVMPVSALVDRPTVMAEFRLNSAISQDRPNVFDGVGDHCDLAGGPYSSIVDTGFIEGTLTPHRPGPTLSCGSLPIP